MSRMPVAQEAWLRRPPAWRNRARARGRWERLPSEQNAMSPGRIATERCDW